MAFSFPFGKKEQIKEYYFGLYMTHENAVGFVFEVVNGKAEIIAKEMCRYSNGWENILEDVDKLISILESETDVHLEQSIFFIHSYMVDKETHEIKNPYKGIIKNIAKQLELKPLGYIEANEAVKDHLQHRDQLPLNMVFIELDSVHVGVYVYKGGKMLFSDSISRTSELIQDVTQLMTQVHSHTLLPSKMTVYGMIKIDDDVEKLIHHKWNTDLFIQAPRIELLKGEELYASLASIFAQQISGVDNDGEVVPEDVMEEEQVMIKEEPEHEETFGFVVGKDVTEESDIQPPTDDVVDRPTKAKPSKGFTMPAFNMGTGLKGKKFSMPSFNGIANPLKNISIPSVGFIVPLSILVVFIAGLFAFEYFFHKAEIVVYMPAETVEKTVDLTLSVGDDGLNAQTFSTDLSEQKETTGKKDIGERAKGQVTIMNFDNAERSFSAGTKLESGGLTFTTDSDVRVASASSVTSGGAKQAGKAKVSATAAVIGPESNISAGKQLKIAGLSDALYVAQVETSFTGGSKKQIQTVARKDIEELKKTLTEKAEQASLEKLTEQVDPKQELLKELTDVTVNEIEYSKDSGEEAETISASATTETTFYTVEKEMLKTKLVTELKEAAPSGFKVEPKQISYTLVSAKSTSEDEESESKEVDIQLDAQAVAVKQADLVKIQSSVASALTSGLEDTLRKEFSATGFEIKTASPPFLTLWTPFFQKNITVTISSK